MATVARKKNQTGRRLQEESMTKKVMVLFAGLFCLGVAFARLAQASGDKASELVVVADTRVLDSGIMLYFADLYNTNILLFAIWAVVLTAGYGCFLGFFMDKLMGMTGLDLSSRKIVEH